MFASQKSYQSIQKFQSFQLKKIRDPGVDKQTNDAFMNYAIELNKLFVSDDPEYYEKEPDYNAFCACFGGNPGDKACDVK